MKSDRFDSRGHHHVKERASQPFAVALIAVGMAFGSVNGTANAATIRGRVMEATGKPLAGAMVSVFNAAGDSKETVYSTRDGRYTITTAFAGHLDVRARSHLFQDQHFAIDASAATDAVLDFHMTPFPDAQALSDSLTASAHIATVKWPDAETRAAFKSQCNYCHQVGNALTRVPKEESLWEKTIARMEGYGATLTSHESSAIAGALHAGLNGQPVSSMQKYVASDELSPAKVHEWQVGDAMSFVHDADVGMDGNLYGTDEGHDILWMLDRRTGKVTQYPLPDSDLPVGGRFVAMQLPIGVFSGKHGPHSLAQGKDGRIWITCALSSMLMSFDPGTKTFKSYQLDDSVLYPHTIRIDAQGIIWFTAAMSNQVVRFDPATQKATVIPLPHDGVLRWFGDVSFPSMLKWSGRWWPKQNVPLKVSPHKWTQGRHMFNLPYGIDVNPKDGSIWYAKLHASKIGRIDPKTLAITEYDTPLEGPRRPRFDKQGILWIPAFDGGALLRFDPATEKFETFKLPLLAANEYETPYALNVHPKTGEIWITSNMSDRVLRFNSATNTFIAYPMPTRVSYLRDIAFTADGQVCSSSSNLPAYGIEGGRGSFLCIDPDGNARPMKAKEADAGRSNAQAANVR